MCYEKWQRFRGSIFKTVLHEGKAIFSTKQANIAKQVQWYFYILENEQFKKKYLKSPYTHFLIQTVVFEFQETILKFQAAAGSSKGCFIFMVSAYYKTSQTTRRQNCII